MCEAARAWGSGLRPLPEAAQRFTPFWRISRGEMDLVRLLLPSAFLRTTVGPGRDLYAGHEPH